MKTVAVKPMACEFAEEGVLSIDKIGTGVVAIFFSSQNRFAAGFHVLRGHSKGRSAGIPGYFSDTAVEYVIQEFTKRGIPLNLSIAIAGGASLLESSEKSEIGTTLVDAVKEAIAAKRLSIKMESTGGAKIRSMVLNIDEGKIKIT
jgi:chemotaxis receptor (MCP) glutamine deamidase CheD